MGVENQIGVGGGWRGRQGSGCDQETGAGLEFYSKCSRKTCKEGSDRI